MHPLHIIRLLEVATADTFILPPVAWAEIFADLEDLNALDPETTPLKEDISDAKLAFLVTKHELSADKIKEIAAYDPTPNGVYVDWLIRHTKSGNLRLPEDAAITDTSACKIRNGKAGLESAPNAPAQAPLTQNSTSK